MFSFGERDRLVSQAPQVLPLLSDGVRVDFYSTDDQRVRRQLGELLMQLPILVYRLRKLIVNTRTGAEKMAGAALIDAIQQLHRTLAEWILDNWNATNTHMSHDEFTQRQRLAIDRVRPAVEEWQALLAVDQMQSTMSPGTPNALAVAPQPGAATPPVPRDQVLFPGAVAPVVNVAQQHVVHPPTASAPLAPTTPPRKRTHHRRWATGPAQLGRDLTQAPMWGVPWLSDALHAVAPLSFTRAYLAEIVTRAWPRAQHGSVEGAVAFDVQIAYVRLGKTRVWHEYEAELREIARTVRPWFPRARLVEERGHRFWKHFPRPSIHMAVGILVAQGLVHVRELQALVAGTPAWSTAIPATPTRTATLPTTRCTTAAPPTTSMSAWSHLPSTVLHLDQPKVKVYSVVQPMRWVAMLTSAGDVSAPNAHRHR